MHRPRQRIENVRPGRTHSVSDLPRFGLPREVRLRPPETRGVPVRDMSARLRRSRIASLRAACAARDRRGTPPCPLRSGSRTRQGSATAPWCASTSRYKGLRAGSEMSGVMTPSRRLSSTTTRGTPPSWRKARSCSSAQTREDDFRASRRTDFRLHPSVRTKRRTRLYFGSRLNNDSTPKPKMARWALTPNWPIPLRLCCGPLKGLNLRLPPCERGTLTIAAIGGATKPTSFSQLHAFPGVSETHSNPQKPAPGRPTRP
jgi:hypothetical protein